MPAACAAANSRTVSSIAKRGSSRASLRTSDVLSSSAGEPHVDLAVAVAPDGRDGVERRAALEHRQQAHQPPLGLVEHLPRPLERRAQRALARRPVARALRQHLEAALEPRQQRREREQADTVGGQLDRQRQAVEPCADRVHHLGVAVGRRPARAGGPGAGEEQRGRVRRRQRMHEVDLLGAEPERGAARRQHGQALDRGEQPGDLAGVVEEALEAVEHEQRGRGAVRARELLAELLGGAGHDVERGGGLGGEQARVLDPVEVDVHGAAGEAPGHAAGGLEREPRLADPARTDEREQARAGPQQQLGDLGELAVAADQVVGRHRQRGGRHARRALGRRARDRARGSSPRGAAARARARSPARRRAGGDRRASPRAPRPGGRCGRGRPSGARAGARAAGSRPRARAARRRDRRRSRRPARRRSAPRPPPSAAPRAGRSPAARTARSDGRRARARATARALPRGRRARSPAGRCDSATRARRSRSSKRWASIASGSMPSA